MTDERQSTMVSFEMKDDFVIGNVALGKRSLATVAVGFLIVVVGVGAILTSPDADMSPNELAAASTTEKPPRGITTRTAPKFTFDVQQVKNCGPVCRNVTGTLVNIGKSPATNVSVTITLSAGNVSIWNNSRWIARIPPDDPFVTEERVRLDPDEALLIQAHNRTVTVEIIVQYDGGTQVINQRRSVV